MSKTFTNTSALKAALLKDTRDAVESAAQRVYDRLQENVDYFYTAPEGKYHRTGLLQASPQIDGLYETDDGAMAQISISTGTQYDPAGRDTQWIYNAAENDELLGHGGFWRGTEAEIANILDEEIRKRF
ncbi:MAG: HK97 gp10 family phage protein [Lachnospiraceae bacterium]|nr:HK97 gp10 family phage protein [Lachnospiraceae bacterium]